MLNIQSNDAGFYTAGFYPAHYLGGNVVEFTAVRGNRDLMYFFAALYLTLIIKRHFYKCRVWDAELPVSQHLAFPLC
jgi:hypothetical protein